MMTYPVGIFEKAPEIMEMLGIPSNHCVCVVVGFGYPKIKYNRGVQRQGINVEHILTSKGVETAGRLGGFYAPDEHLDDCIPDVCENNSLSIE